MTEQQLHKLRSGLVGCWVEEKGTMKKKQPMSREESLAMVFYERYQRDMIRVYGWRNGDWDSLPNKHKKASIKAMRAVLAVLEKEKQHD